MRMDERTRARIIGAYNPRMELISYVSSGSEHEAAPDVDNDDNESPSLSDLVDCFLEESFEDGNNVEASDSDSERATDLLEADLSDLSEKLNGVMEARELVQDQYRDLLVVQVRDAMKMFSFYGSPNITRQMLYRDVMSYLRNLGHNAAICKTKWDNYGGLASGSYEFIDVVMSDVSNVRYFVDLDFASKFEIARPSESYSKFLSLLPVNFVGREDELKKMVRIMSDAAKRSLKCRELHLPPWRKNRFMQMKWFGPYRRTVNALPASSSAASLSGGESKVKATPAIKCSVGFELPACDDALGAGYFVRTR